MCEPNLKAPKTSGQTSPNDKENSETRAPGILSALEQLGKSFAWLIQVAIALGAGATGYFAYTLSVDQFSFQQKSLALQVLRDFTLDGRSKDERFGLACIKRILAVANQKPDGRSVFIDWWNSKNHAMSLPKGAGEVGLCDQSILQSATTISPNQKPVNINQQIYREILSALNSYETYLARIDAHVGDTELLCKEIPLSKSSAVSKLIATWQADLTEPKRGKNKDTAISTLLSEYPELRSYVNGRGAYAICAGSKKANVSVDPSNRPAPALGKG